MKRIEIRFDLVPKPKGRPRIRCKPHPSAYTPPATVKYENAIKAIATKEVLDRGGTIPFFSGDRGVSLVADFSIPIPHILDGVRLKKKERGEMDGRWARGGPDLDNLIKSLMDGLAGVLYNNDKIVNKIETRKFYSKTTYVEIWASERIEECAGE